MIRLIRFRFRKTTRALVEDFARERKTDPSFMLDLYALLYHQGNGLPTEDRLKKIIKAYAKKHGVSEMSTGAIARKKMQQLKVIIANGIFGVCALRRKDLIGGLRSLFSSLKEAEMKIRQSQCQTCSLVKNCEFGKQYGETVYNISRVLDPDYAKKADPNCPHLPELDESNRLANAAEEFEKFFSEENQPEQEIVKEHSDADEQGVNELAEAQKKMDEADDLAKDDDEEDENLDNDAPEDELEDDYEFMAHRTSPMGGPGSFSTSFVGRNTRNPEDTVKSISAAQLAIFELGRKFSLMLTAQKKGKWAPTHINDQNSRGAKMEKLSDMTKLNSSQHGLPDEIFDAKLSRKDLTKQQPLKPEDKKKLLYLLIDSSGSMRGWLGANPHVKGLLTRASLSATIALALSRRVEDDKGTCFLRFFDHRTSRRFAGNSPESFEALRNGIALCSFDGGGTNIIGAITTCVADIQAAQATDEISQAEILCLTDCEDSFNERDLRNAVGTVEFNVLDVSGIKFSSNNGTALALKKVASKYYKADEKTVDLQKLVDLV